MSKFSTIWVTLQQANKTMMRTSYLRIAYVHPGNFDDGQLDMWNMHKTTLIDMTTDNRCISFVVSSLTLKHKDKGS